MEYIDRTFRHDNKNILEHLGSKKLLKIFHKPDGSDGSSRWSARADAVSALHVGHEQVNEALISIAKDTKQSRETRDEALSLSRKMKKTRIYYTNRNLELYFRKNRQNK